MRGTLFIVATPIGNLEDVTLRALRVLREVGLIAAEDTRRTARLLNHYDIRTRSTSLHEHNERSKTRWLVGRLEHGEDVALVSDAGTPAISDPGATLIKAALAAGIRVVPVPGASAVLAALVASGCDAGAFSFVGFPPSRSKDRKKWLQEIAGEPRTIVFFEAPHRVLKTLAEMQATLGDREIVVWRELTKLHEELVRGPISEVRAAVGEPRGEFTLVLPPVALQEASSQTLPADVDLWVEFGLLTKSEQLDRRGALIALAARYNLPTRDVYAALERGKKSVERPNIEHGAK